MRPKCQIRNIFELQVLRDFPRRTAESIHALLRVHRVGPDVFLSDGVHATRLKPRKLRRKKTQKGLGRFHNELRHGGLYIFHKCRLNFQPSSDGIHSFLDSKGFGFVAPDLSGTDLVLPTLLEHDLDDTELQHIRRKVH